jgi:hypothetical protein
MTTRKQQQESNGEGRRAEAGVTVKGGCLRFVRNDGRKGALRNDRKSVERQQQIPCGNDIQKSDN